MTKCGIYSNFYIERVEHFFFLLMHSRSGLVGQSYTGGATVQAVAMVIVDNLFIYSFIFFVKSGYSIDDGDI